MVTEGKMLDKSTDVRLGHGRAGSTLRGTAQAPAHLDALQLRALAVYLPVALIFRGYLRVSGAFGEPCSSVAPKDHVRAPVAPDFLERTVEHPAGAHRMVEAR